MTAKKVPKSAVRIAIFLLCIMLSNFALAGEARAKKTQKKLADSQPSAKAEEQYGLVQNLNNITFLETENGNLKNGSAISIVSLNKKQSVISAIVFSKVNRTERFDKLFSQLNQARGDDGHSLSVYYVKSKSIVDGFQFGIAPLTSHTRFHTNGNQIEAIESTDTAVTFRSCMTQEGMHFSAWKGQPLTGTRLWHQYLALGYDLEVNNSDCKCDKADYQ